MAANMGVMKKYMNWMAIAVLAFWFTPVGAQDPEKMSGEMDAMPGMDHDSMHGHSASADDTSMDTMSDMDHGQMDHGNMSSKDTETLRKEGGMSHGAMHGGSAPSDARDPHAYSGGYTLDPTRPLKLADEHNFGSLRVDRLESIRTRDSSSIAYSLQGWFGRDYDRAVIKAEGDIDNGKLQETQTDLLWSHAIATYWDTQLGIRYDSGTGPNRGWLALGVQGLAPYWFDVNITTYIGDEGRSALQLEADYELLLTQKLVLQPRVEANLYGKRDIERGLGSGLSDTSFGLRLRYEIRREIAPYAGIEWSKKFGSTADYARDAEQEASEMRVVAGIRFWF